jgi:hypothetical protein
MRQPGDTPFSFGFPPPNNGAQSLRYTDAPRGEDESKVCLLSRPPFKPGEEEAIVARVEQGHYLLGICAFQNWPGRIHNPRDPDALRAFDLFSTPYYRRFVGFMHNFREPRDVFPDDLPLLEMDFSDYLQVRKKGREKRYDLVYYAGHKIDDKPATVAWSRVVKQHDLALGLIREVLATEPDARICLVHDSFDIDDPRVERFDFLGYREFLDKVEASRIMLVASVLDASPRVLTEALCLDTYVMVNERISGGWKYVNAETGAFFDQGNALDVYRRLRARPPAQTRAWFLRNYPNHLLEARFNAWLNACILAYCVFNRFGRVYYLNADGAEEQRLAILRELFGFMGVYGDCVERIAATPSPGDPERGRALSHLAALRRARELALPDAVILEDDFHFIAPRQVANRKMEALLRGFPEWDVILLGSGDVTEDEATRDPGVRRVRGASLPHGYAVNARFYDRLIAALEGSGEMPLSGLFKSANASIYMFHASIGEGLGADGPRRWA